MVDYGCFYFGKVSHNLVSENPTHWDRKCSFRFHGTVGPEMEITCLYRKCLDKK